MDEVIGFLGFSLGVAVAGSLVRSLSGGLRPVARGVIKAGLVATDMVATTTSRARSAAASMAAEARENLDDLRAEAASERASDTAPQHIVIAHD